MELPELQARLARVMDERGLWPADSPWVRPTMETYARHLFAPDRLWTWDGEAYVNVDRASDAKAWADLVYADPADSTITQVSDGLPTSSLSCEEVVADMLDSLMLEAGQPTLELGAATGRNARLLAERAGPGMVTTVEYDPRLAATAAANLAATGGGVEVITGDGVAGAPGRKFLRVISTFAVEEVPWAWVAQTAPGGRIVTPWGRLGHVALTVAPDGQSATGWVQGLATFMPARGTNQGLEWDQIRGSRPPAAEEPFARDVQQLHQNASLLFALRVIAPDIRVRTATDNSAVTIWLHDGHTSWATIASDMGEGTGVSRQGGPRRLAAELDAAWKQWVAAGAPSLYDFGMTRTWEGQYIWAHDPETGPRWSTAETPPLRAA
ncbi:protein-L-isoaspartate O-methyltransferase [Streptomyces chattanoogensis]|uniref:Protein-L-isoaspartate O-methyltransferase n=1 Tax=Streptomyces chattanoogensis TaxID=66876 RepID=A0A0N0XYQ7_9ACTN|nr:protein-L-isoaspartate O-methyltransferase [Streptomyces chattanoogensis]KPC64266.1 protein-L-isoaspartate O-methyltransferase [Streptomyces chattanoogensis]